MRNREMRNLHGKPLLSSKNSLLPEGNRLQISAKKAHRRRKTAERAGCGRLFSGVREESPLTISERLTS